MAHPIKLAGNLRPSEPARLPAAALGGRGMPLGCQAEAMLRLWVRMANSLRKIDFSHNRFAAKGEVSQIC